MEGVVALAPRISRTRATEGNSSSTSCIAFASSCPATAETKDDFDWWFSLVSHRIITLFYTYRRFMWFSLVFASSSLASAIIYTMSLSALHDIVNKMHACSRLELEWIVFAVLFFVWWAPQIHPLFFSFDWVEVGLIRTVPYHAFFLVVKIHKFIASGHVLLDEVPCCVVGACMYRCNGTVGIGFLRPLAGSM